MHNVRIFRPEEYRIFRDLLSQEKVIILDSLLLTGMRYEEFLRFRENEDWFDGQSIHVPEWAQPKVIKVTKGKHRRAVRRQLPRWVRLSIAGKTTIPNLFNVRIPTKTSLDQFLKRWAFKAFSLQGLPVDGVSVKTFRKTWESWLMFYYPDRVQYIYESQGHNELTSLRHYIGIPFQEEDKVSMKDFVEGWI